MMRLMYRVPLVQMSRDCFGRYLKLTRRALSDAAAIAAATAAGISSAGSPLQPLEASLKAAEAAASAAAAEEGYGARKPSPADESIAAGGQPCGHQCSCSFAA